MPTYEEIYADAVVTSQKLKLAKSGEFPEAVKNIHQLLDGDARGEADSFWGRLQASAKKQVAQILKRAESYEVADRDYKIGIEKARMAWEHADKFLEFLISLGHKYNLFPRMPRVESVEPSYPSAVTE